MKETGPQIVERIWSEILGAMKADRESVLSVVHAKSPEDGSVTRILRFNGETIAPVDGDPARDEFTAGELIAKVNFAKADGTIHEHGHTKTNLVESWDYRPISR